MYEYPDSYIILLQVLLLVGLCVLQVFVDGSDLPFLVIDGLVKRLQLLLDPLVPLLFGGELAASALFGVQVCALLSGLGQSGGESNNSTLSDSVMIGQREAISEFISLVAKLAFT